MKMKISDYLMRCELVVLIKLVHVSVVAWLLLTGTANLLYFVLGIVSYESEDMGIIGTSLEYLFFISMGGFIVIALVLRQKMLSVFRLMMHQQTLWGMNHSTEEKEQLALIQLRLFWLGSPKLVIAAIQFMQFGYALALSVVLIFWSVIEAGHITMRWYIIMIAATYSIFLWVVANVIPEYTLCTSLGQLIDHRRLHETVSNFRLEDARRRRAEQIDLNMESPDVITAAEPKPLPVGDLSTVTSSEINNVDRLGALPTVGKTKLPIDKSISQSLADFVKLNTSELRSSLPDAEKAAMIRRERRRQRLRSVSDGVKLMAQLADDVKPLPTDSISGGERDKDFLIETRRRARSARRKSVSDGVALMASAMSAGEGLRPPGRSTPTTRSRSQTPVHFALVTSDTKLLRELLPETERLALEERESMKRSDSGSRLVHALTSRLLDHVSVSRDDLDVPYSRHSMKTNPVEALSVDHSPRELLSSRRARSSRRKAVSDGVAWMASTRPSSLDLAATSPAPSKNSGHDTAQIQLKEISSFPNPRATLVIQPTVRPALSTGMAEVVAPDDAWKERDEASRNSTDSVYDYSSDGSIPEAIVVERDIPQERFSFERWLRSYYLSKRFVLLSNVLGTMVVFFFIGQRVESFLSSEGLTDPEVFVSFDFPNKMNFWIIFTWYSMFLTTNGAILWLLRGWSKQPSGQEKALVVSSYLDTALIGFCLTMFCIAEAQRCCYTEESTQTFHRSLATTGETQASSETYRDPAPCSCPAFGSRSFGGLGNLEPLTSLIALRILRHAVARYFVNFSESKVALVSMEQSNAGFSNPRLAMSPFAVFGGVQKEGENHMKHEHGSIVELWQAAVERYPTIVAKYGEFSGELLQAMLGVPIIEQGSPTATMTSYLQRNESSAMYGQNQMLLDTRYSRLAPDVQEVIMAGKVGKRVRSMMDLTIREEEEVGNSDEGRSPLKLHFEVDQEKANSMDHEESQFSAPNSRLVRSMRRGDRKLLPILQSWSTVDVVITRFEIVYFDATDVDSPSNNQLLETSKQAIIATKGGKGLRLCDVAVGRTVVGHLDLSDIESVFVERELPNAHDLSGSDSPAVHVAKIEYWQNRSIDSKFNRAEHWNTTNQDILRIQTTNGRTLHLRFYSDLVDSEANPERVLAENEAFGTIFKNNALQWAQTLVRFCGPEQLKQNLPHFGDDTCEELRDILHVKKTVTHRRLASRDGPTLHRVFSQRNLSSASTSTSPNINATARKPVLARRASTILDGARRRNQKPLLHRSSSVSAVFTGNVDGFSDDSDKMGAHLGSDGDCHDGHGAASAMNSLGSALASSAGLPRHLSSEAHAAPSLSPTSADEDLVNVETMKEDYV
jgi:hypothetical protein